MKRCNRVVIFLYCRISHCRHVSVLTSVGLVPSWVPWVACYRATVPSWVQIFFSWVFRESEIFSRGYFSGFKNFLSWVLHGSRFFLVGALWVQICSRGYFVGPKFFLVGISWVQFFLVGIFVVPRFFLAYAR